jgi:hypothetical protein
MTTDDVNKVVSKLECEDENNRKNVQELIDPDRVNHFIASFQRINNKVGNEEDSSGKQGWMDNQDKYSRIGGTMVEIDFPAFPLLSTHPRALKGKISDKMACQPDKQRGNRDVKQHTVLPL